MNLFDEEPERSSIKALPETIQEIYDLANESKKRTNKKNTKKKDKK